MTGTAGAAGVTGIGLGPGDPELITVKGRRLLREAAVVAYPAPERGDSLARRLAAPHLPGGQIELAIRMPIADASFPKDEIYDAAARTILGHVAAGRPVAVLCEGDPLLYGSFQYLLARLEGRCPVAVVPGISSVMACAAHRRRPLAARDDILSVIPATLPDAAIAAALAAADRAAILKVGRHLGRVRALLAGAGRLGSTDYVARATMPEEHAAPLADLPEDHAAPYFSTLLVGRGDG